MSVRIGIGGSTGARVGRFLSSGLLGCGMLCACCAGLAAQTSGNPAQTVAHSAKVQPASAKPTPRKTAAKRRRAAARHRKLIAHKLPLPAKPVPPAPPAPPPAPDWPALSAAEPATVHWDGKQLSITANNSSLRQVIAAITAQTHIPVTGLQSDARLFGDYGPASPRQVFSQLLEGSGYDLLMVSGEDPGIPQRVELHARSGAVQPERPAYSAAQPTEAPVNPGIAQQQLAAPQPLNRPDLNQPKGVPPGMTPQEYIQQRMQMIQRQQQAAPQPQ